MSGTCESFLEALSKPQPDPGGGAAAAYGALLGLALLEKIVRLEFKRNPGRHSDARFWEDLLTRLQQLKADFARLQREDVEAYRALAATRKWAGSQTEFAAAFAEAMRCPLEIMRKTHLATAILTDTGNHCKKHLVADLQVAAAFLAGAAQGAHHIAYANTQLTRNVSGRENYLQQLKRLREQGEKDARQAEHLLAARLGFGSNKTPGNSGPGWQPAPESTS